MNKKKQKLLIGIITCIIIFMIIVAIVTLIIRKHTIKDANSVKTDYVTISLDLSYTEKANVKLGYTKDSKITEEKSDYGNLVIFTNKEKNYVLELALLNESEESFNNNKEYFSSQDGFKEVEFNKYKGFIYQNFTSTVSGRILLDSSKKDNGLFKFIEFKIEPVDSYLDENGVNAYTLYELNEIQSLLKSIEYEIISTGIRNSNNEEVTEEQKSNEIENNNEEITPEEEMIVEENVETSNSDNN